MNKKITNFITVDLEDWYTSSYEVFDQNVDPKKLIPSKSIVRNTISVLNLFDKFNTKATFFVLGITAEHYPELIKIIHRKGHEIATHTYYHRFLYKLKKKEIKKEIEDSINLLQNIIGEKIIGLRAPYFSIIKNNTWVLDIASECGIKYDSSIFPMQRKMCGISNFESRIQKLSNGIWEFPVSVLKTKLLSLPFAGGGFLRLLPATYFHQCIKKFNSSNKPAILYFHPYEFDPTDIKNLSQKTGKSLKKRFFLWQQSIGRTKIKRKLEYLLKQHKFQPIRDGLKNIKSFL